VPGAFGDQLGQFRSIDRETFVREYLAPEHRDDPGSGCPAAGFGGDPAHGERGSAAVPAYAEGIEQYADWLGDLPSVAMLVGAMVLARATAGTEISDRILAEARRALSEA
jgi:TetR/AcrR family transcriptional repressor of nem operon